MASGISPAAAKKEGRVACESLLSLSNCHPVEVSIDGGATLTIEAGKAPIINGVTEERMRVGCGSATIGMFAKQWQGLVDDVVVVDDHITGVLSEHQAGKFLGVPETGVRMKVAPLHSPRPLLQGGRARNRLGRH